MGKGNIGRALAASETMTLSAIQRLHHAVAHLLRLQHQSRPARFLRRVPAQLDALLHPDYTDEEIRREVRNFGVSENPATHQLRLEEKGTVYNEMVEFDE